jgi:hypothetical protein
MSILTNLPVTSVCGTPVVVTIDKTEFVTDFGIVDPFWIDPANWQEIEFYYTDDANILQVKKMSFASNNYTLNLKTNTYNGNMLCQKVTLMDGNGGTLAFARSAFPTANEFDFAVSGGYPFIPLLNVMDTFYNQISYNINDELFIGPTVANWGNTAYRSIAVSGDFVFSGIVNVTGIGFTDVMMGYQKIAMPVSASQTNPELNMATAIYGASSGQYNFYAGTGNTAAIGANFSGATAPRNYEISRVAGVITATIDGNIIFTDNYALDVYLGVTISNSVSVLITTDLI